MGDTVTKLQVSGDSGAGCCSYDYKTKVSSSSMIPISISGEINEKESFSAQFGSVPGPASHPIVHSFPSQCHIPIAGRQQDFFNMRALGAALPDLMFQNYSNTFDQHFILGASLQSPNQVTYPIPNTLQQFSGHPTIAPSPTSHLSYHAAFQTQLPSMYTMSSATATAATGTGTTPQPPLTLPLPSNPSLLYFNMGSFPFQSSAYNGQTQPTSFFLQPAQYPSVQNRFYFANQIFGVPSGRVLSGSPQEGLDYVCGISSSSNNSNNGCAQNRYQKPAANQIQSSVVRGPPRKPRQSGHAIWIGNLPPHIDLMSLVHHVCKETKGLESLFLISKSNCAFANFKDEEACIAAQSKVHESRFQTVRLVSRLRKDSSCTNYNSTVPSGPSVSLKTTQQTVATRTPSPQNDTKTRDFDQNSGTESNNLMEKILHPKDKFFVVKSLTVEDLEQSVKNGVWATQSHNERALNEAFHTCENVFLIFSANKSGEYFGYARMISPIDEDPAAAIEFSPKIYTAEDTELPKAILTPASEFAPKGRIIDDSARGTIFWEVDKDDELEEEEFEEIESDRSIPEDSPPKAWGKPFKIEWISTVRLPFFRTKGLRNSWNSNREVKVARDGTELETNIGRKLIALFHRLPSPITSTGVSIPLIGGYQQIHQF